MKIYAISGLGADERVFKYLTINYDLIPIKWITPKKDESIEDYSIRLSEVINQNEKFGILGVSFGGLIAIEISKKINPEFTILISSAETKKELRPLYSLFGKTNIINLIPKQLFYLPAGLASFLFGTNQKQLLKNILNDTDSSFTKWAIRELINWKNTKTINNCIKISGTKDKLIPPKKNSTTILIEKGGHFMIVDKAKEISDIINKKLSENTSLRGTKQSQA